MTDQKHTPEPWEARKDPQRWIVKAIYGSFGMDDSQLIPARMGAGVREEANAERIVACVNACAGLNPEAVPEMVKALEAVCTNRDPVGFGQAIKAARAALERARTP